MFSLLRFNILHLLAVFALVPFQLCADDTIYTVVDVNPVPVKTPPPEYPEDLKRLGVNGVVAVSIVIDEKGKVISATIAKSSRRDFEASALEAIKKWTFKPAKKDGVAVKVRVTIPLRFDLEDE